MIHTSQIFIRITQREYKRLARKAAAKVAENGDISIGGLEGKGMRQIRAYQQRGDPLIFYWLELVINLNEVARNGEQTPHPFEVTEENVCSLKENFAKFIGEILPRRTDIAKWKVNRIDYTFDVKLQNVGEYIALLQRGDKPHGMTIDNEEQHKSEIEKTHRKNTVRYKNKSCRISVYDKFEERAQKSNYPPPLLAECKNILRIELQCYKRKVEAMEKSLEGKRFLHHLIPEERQRNLIGYYLLRIGGKGTYYTLDRAFKEIEKSGCSPNTKEDMKRFLRDVNKERSVWKVKKKQGKRKTQSPLQSLKRLEINPVTIPRNWGKSSISSLYTAKFHTDTQLPEK